MLKQSQKDDLLEALMKVPGTESFSTRTVLLSGIPVMLNRSENNAFVDLSNVITQLDRLGRLQNGEHPVVILAHNAVRMVTGSELAAQLSRIQREIEEFYAEEPPLPDLPSVPEALVFGGPGEWVYWTFLRHAEVVAGAIARVRVPRVIGGKEARATGAVGTAWLIAPGLLLTNHHVINAREPGEPAASDSDFIMQGKTVMAWFDYRTVNDEEKVEIAVLDIVASNRALDYALLAAPADACAARTPLSVPQQAPLLDRGTRLNVVQHPGGGPLRFAIRNNFFVGRGDNPFQIRYLTDTDHGSSGAPVLDDNWQVVALHHGAQKVNPKVYAGEPGFEKVVKYHNEGIAIQSIIADLPKDVAADIRKAQGWK